MMNLPVTGRIDSSGSFEIGGCSATELVKKFGTPLYVVDEEEVRKNCRAYRALFASKYPNSEIVYATKALSAVGILKIIKEEGLGVDVSSGGELYTALKAKLDPKKIYFHGNSKSIKEIEEGLSAKVGRFVVDNFNEIGVIDKLTCKSGKTANIMIRVNPGVEAHTHDAVKTGQTDSKFGIATEDVLEAVKLVKAMKNSLFVGLHAHIGSQIFDEKGFLSEIDVLCDIAKSLKDKLSVEVEELNIGGGVGIAYTENDAPIALEMFADRITGRIKERALGLKIKLPKLILEPGRSIIARAGITLYKVGHIKEIKGIRKYVVVDGGMADNIRPMLYGSQYQFIVANRSTGARTEKVTIAGRFCESGDVLAKDIEMPGVAKGDILAALCTGAYNYSMASNYNRVQRPAMVIVKDGKARIIVRRESYEDITRCDAT